MSTLTEQLTTYYKIKHAVDEGEAEMKARKPSLLDAFRQHIDENGEDGHKVFIRTEDEKGHALYVAPTEATELNLDELWERLTPEQRKLVHKDSIDMAKLEAAVQLGHIDAALLDQCSEKKPRSAYVRFYMKALPKKLVTRQPTAAESTPPRRVARASSRAVRRAG